MKKKICAIARKHHVTSTEKTTLAFTRALSCISKTIITIDPKPTVYIAYAWGNTSHSAWVKRFEEHLSMAGIVKTHFDRRWDDGGNMTRGDVSEFVQRIENSSHVIVIATKELMKKLYCSDTSPCRLDPHNPNHVIKNEMQLIEKKHTKTPMAVLTVLLDGDDTASIPECLRTPPASYTDMRPFLHSMTSDNDPETYYEKTLRMILALLPNAVSINAANYIKHVAETFSPEEIKKSDAHSIRNNATRMTPMSEIKKAALDVVKTAPEIQKGSIGLMDAMNAPTTQHTQLLAAIVNANPHLAGSVLEKLPQHAAPQPTNPEDPNLKMVLDITKHIIDK